MSNVTFTRKNSTQCFPKFALVPVSFDDQHSSGSGHLLEPCSKPGQADPCSQTCLPSQLLLLGWGATSPWKAQGTQGRQEPRQGNRGASVSDLPHSLQGVRVEAAAKTGGVQLCLIRVFAVSEPPPHTHPTQHWSVLLMLSLFLTLSLFVLTSSQVGTRQLAGRAGSPEHMRRSEPWKAGCVTDSGPGSGRPCSDHLPAASDRLRP